MSILIGCLLGLSTLAFIGPVLFYLLKSSVESGWKAGFMVALGIIVGDIICVLLAILGSHQFLMKEAQVLWIALIGGSLLTLMGLKFVIFPSVKEWAKTHLNSGSAFIYFFNGFIINFVNPFVFAVWFGFATYLRESFNQESDVIIALVCALIMIFLTDSLKAIFASKLSKFIQPQRLQKWMRVFGLLMIGFGIRLLIYTWM